jgi:hypothetical protein
VDAVERRQLFEDRVHLPRLVDVIPLPEPLERPAGLGVRELPVGAQHHVELAVAIQVLEGDADVVVFGPGLGVMVCSFHPPALSNQMTRLESQTTTSFFPSPLTSTRRTA